MDEFPSILDALEAQLTPEAIKQMSGRLGADAVASSNAISMTLPILLGGLSDFAADAEGAAALDAALGTNDGTVLGKVLGARRGPVQEGVARATGLTAPQVGELLALLGPVVMGVLAQMREQESVGAEQLPVVLGKATLDLARQSTATGDLSRILATDEEVPIADEIARIGSSIVGGMLGRDAGS